MQIVLRPIVVCCALAFAMAVLSASTAMAAEESLSERAASQQARATADAEAAARSAATDAARAEGQQQLDAARTESEAGLSQAWDEAVQEATVARPFERVPHRAWALMIAVVWLVVQWKVVRRRAANHSR